MRKYTETIMHGFIAILLYCSMVVSSSAEEFVSSSYLPIVDINADYVQNIGQDLHFIEDKENKYSIGQVMSFDKSLWQKSVNDTPNFGYTNSSYWFRISLHTPDRSLEKLLAIQYALLDYIEFYISENGQIQKHIVTGDTFTFFQRPLRHRDFLFPIKFQQNQTLDIFLKVKSEGSLQVPISLWDRQQFIWQDQDELFLKAVYYGMLLILIVYNLFLFISIQERSYLYYGGLVVSVLVLMAGSHGFLYQYLYPNSPFLHKLSMLVAPPSVMLFAGLFASYFLSLSKLAPRLNRIVNFFNIVFFCSIIAAFFLPYDISTRISVFLAIPSSAVIMLAGPYAWIKGQRSARYFTYAWAFLITGIIVSASSKFGFLPRNMFTEYALSLGSAIEALLLSFALADRFSREKHEKIKAQQARLEEENQRKTAEEKLYKQTTHQSLDGFPNTVLFQKVLYRLLNEDEVETTSFSLLYVQLDGINDISKTLGHANADIVLSLFSKRILRLNNCYKKSVVIETTEQGDYHFAHIEKGLFGHILSNIELNNAIEYAHELMMLLSEPIEYKGMKLDLGASIGISCYPIHGKDIATLTRHARVAIDYADNSNGKIGVYSEDINPYSERRLVLMGELKKAIDNDALDLHYQPIISCQNGDVVGAEALLRWNHETLGYISPDEFILIAEQTGIMRYLTRWVLRRAFSDHAKRTRLYGKSTISINISAVNLHEPDFESTILQLLETYDIQPEDLVLEITETSVMQDPEYAVSALKRLASRSIKLAIDDFGTGYSSLTYIQQLPLYEIKIDRSFVQNMDQKSGDQIIVKTTLNMSKDLGYRVVAEGIENYSVLNSLKKLQCDFAQGFYIAKPMPIEEFINWQKVLKRDEIFKEQKNLS